MKESPTFREVLKNSAVRRNKQKEIFETFAPQSYNELTINFINVIIEAGRYYCIQIDCLNSKRPLTLISITAKYSIKRKTFE